MIGWKGKFWLDEKAVLEATRQATIGPLEKCALTVERQAKIITSKGGRIAAGKSGKFKSVPSPVGQPPHRQTGALSNSISWAFARSTKTGRRTAIVGPTTVAWYGKIHEHSTRFPRPFMRPALDHERPKFPRFFRNMKLAQTPAGRRLNSGKGIKRAR